MLPTQQFLDHLPVAFTSVLLTLTTTIIIHSTVLFVIIYDRIITRIAMPTVYSNHRIMSRTTFNIHS